MQTESVELQEKRSQYFFNFLSCWYSPTLLEWDGKQLVGIFKYVTISILKDKLEMRRLTCSRLPSTDSINNIRHKPWIISLYITYSSFSPYVHSHLSMLAKSLKIVLLTMITLCGCVSHFKVTVIVTYWLPVRSTEVEKHHY